MSQRRKRITGNIVLAILALAGAALLVVCGLIVYGQFRTHEIKIAVGKPKSDTFAIMQAMKTVMARHYPRIRITLHETAGTEDNLNRLGWGSAELAVSQADADAPPVARTVAVLFEDVFQLVVHKDPVAADSGARAPAARAAAAILTSPAISGFDALQGKKIGLSKTGGQFKAFLFLAAQYNLKESDFTFVGGDDASADAAFKKNEADAVFRIRALLNPEIAALVSGGGAAFLPLDNAPILHAKNPAYTVTTIPRGTYSVSPLMPSADVPTVQVQRVLLARQEVDADVVSAIREVLMDRRHELAAALVLEFQPVRYLLAHITQESLNAGLNAPVHPGALPDYQKQGSSFVGRHTNALTLFFAICVLLVLWTVEMRRLSENLKKRHGDAYNLKAAGLMEAAYRSEPPGQIGTELLEIFADAVKDLESDKLSSDSFHSFHTIWKTAMDAVIARHGNGPALPAPSAPVAKTSRWSLVKYLQPKSNS